MMHLYNQNCPCVGKSPGNAFIYSIKHSKLTIESQQFGRRETLNKPRRERTYSNHQRVIKGAYVIKVSIDK